MTDDPTLRQALAYARRGWPVFPCQPGQKIPATPHGYRDASTDPEQITAWFGRDPGCNLAIATGFPGPDVLDVDQHGPAGDGFAALDQAPRRRAAGRRRRLRPHPQRRHARLLHRHPPALRPPARAPPGLPAPPAATSWPRPRRSAASPTGSCGNPAAAAALNWDTVTRLLQPRRSTSRTAARPGPPVLIWDTWPAGSPPSPKATATRACSGPRTAPWKLTPPPT